MTQAVAKVMVDQGVKNGSIVNLASIVGKVRKNYVVCCAVEPSSIMESYRFSIDDRDGNKNIKTARITLFCTFLCRCCMTAMENA